MCPYHYPTNTILIKFVYINIQYGQFWCSSILIFSESKTKLTNFGFSKNQTKIKSNQEKTGKKKSIEFGQFRSIHLVWLFIFIFFNYFFLNPLGKFEHKEVL